MKEALEAWTGTLERVFATKSAESTDTPVEEKLYDTSDIHICSHKIGQPTVFIPVFPGTNCEYDSARAFERAGGEGDHESIPQPECRGYPGFCG